MCSIQETFKELFFLNLWIYEEKFVIIFFMHRLSSLPNNFKFPKHKRVKFYVWRKQNLLKVLDEIFNWNHHLKSVKNKASSAFFALSNVKNILPSNIKLTIYISLFRSFIEYGISAWGKNKSSEMKQIPILD